VSGVADRCWDLFREGQLAQAIALAREGLESAEQQEQGVGPAAVLLARLLALAMHHHDAAALLGRAVRELPDDDHQAIGTAWLEQARALERLGRFREADVAWASAQAAWEQGGDPASLARLLCQRSLSGVHRGHHTQALALLESAWAGPVVRDGASEVEAQVLAHLGDVRARLGQTEQAFEALDRAVALIRQRGNGDDLVWVLNTLGDVRRRAGHWDLALAAYDEALETAARHAPGRAVIVKHNRALLHLQRGQWDLADPGRDPVPWREAFPVLVQLALAAARGKDRETGQHLFRAESLLVAQPLADVDLLTALQVAAERCEESSWPTLALRCWRLVHAQAVGLGDSAIQGAVQRAVTRLGAQGAAPLLGPFQLQHRLGAGAMGVVWRAVHVQDDQVVAIKVLTGSGAQRRAIVAALETEGRAMARLDHPGVVQVLDTGVVDDVASWTSLDGLRPASPYVVMSLAESSLDPRDGAGDWTVLRDRLDQVLDALAHAHALGVLHLDVKPENLLVDSAGRVLITDFGLTHALGSQDRRAVSGTPDFMAPEQVRPGSAPLSPATDLYAVGGLATVLATGRPVYAGRSTEQLFHAHLHQEPAPLPDGGPWPPAFDAWRRWLLAKDPTARPGSAAQALAALRALDGQPATDGTPDWRRPRGEPAPVPMGAGLGLVDHRVPALQGRADACDALWRAVRSARRTGHCAAAHVTGPPGIGRTALVEGLVRRVRELGVATAVLVRADGQGRADCLHAALVRAGQGLQLRGGLAWSWTAGAAALGAQLDRGPVLLVVDDLHRDPGLAGVLGRWLPGLLGRPLALVTTALDGPEDPHASELLSLCQADRIVLDPLDDRSLAQAIRALAPLSRDLVGRVLQASAGNPGRAVALVRHHVAAGGLVPGPDGYNLAGELEAGAPASTSDVWAATVRRLLGAIDESTWQALERLACWDGLVPLARLQGGRLGPAAGLLVRRGLARQQDEHLILPLATRELLRARARSGGRLRAHHQAWAEALDGEPALDDRRARHLLAAGRPLEAVPLLVESARAAVQAVDLVAGAQALVLARRAIGEAGLGAGDRHQLALEIVEVRRHLEAGDFQPGLVQGRGLLQRLPAASHPVLRARTLALLGRLEHGDRDPAAGERHAVEAWALARQSGDTEALVESAAGQFERQSIDGRLSEVGSLLDEASAQVAAGGSEWARVYLLRTRARLALHLADYAECVALNQEILALPYARCSPRFAGEAWVALGEVHRLRGDLAGAEDAYDRAVELLAQTGAAVAWLPRLNQVLVLIARGQHQRARARAESLWLTVGRLGLTGIMAPAAALVLRYRAGDDPDEPLRQPLRELTEAVRAGNASESDYVDLLLAAAQAAQAIGRPDRVRRLWHLAAIVLRQLDRDDEARALEVQMACL